MSQTLMVPMRPLERSKDGAAGSPPTSWSAAGAPVLTVRDLRRR